MEAAKRKLAELDLHAFVEQAWHVLEPHNDFVPGKHVEVVCRWLQDVTDGKRKRIAINIPPGMTKTMIVSVLWPCWEWISRPHLRYNFFAYAQELATDASRLRRRLLTSDWYQNRWPHVQLAPDNNQAMQFSSTTSPGSMIAGSVGGIATGRGGERLVIDDPMNPRMAHSDVEREGAERWLRQTLPSRLRTQSGAVVLIMQRLHELDSTALALDFGFEHLCLPWHYEPDHPHVSPDDWRTEAGEPLAPLRFTEDYMAQLRKQMGEYGWAGQYQQRPSPAGGGIWRAEFFKDAKTMRSGGRRHIFNVADLAYSSKQTADYTVIMTFSGDTSTGELEIVEVVRVRADVLDTSEAKQHRWLLRDARTRMHAEYTLVEKAGLASRVIEFAQREGEPVAGIDADRDKVARARAGVIIGEMGNLYVDKTAPWWSTLWHEVASFPNGAHDDQADCVAYGCIHWRDLITGGRDGDLSSLGYGLADQYA